MGWLTKTYTAADVHAAVVAKNLALLTNMIELHKQEALKVPQKITDEYSRLANLGLSGTKNAQILKSKIDEIANTNEEIALHNKRVEEQQYFCKFLEEMIEVFGHNTILISFIDFEEIVRKYNLTCGLLSHYTGSIPEKNLVEIEEAREKLHKVRTKTKSSFSWDYAYPYLRENIKLLAYINEIDKDYAKLSEEDMKAIQLFPFVDNSGSYHYNVLSINKDVYHRYIKLEANTDLFIVAPYNEMTNGVKFTNFVKTEDPFVCSYTPFGIMIHTAWGEEAEDEILEKYKQLINI